MPALQPPRSAAPTRILVKLRPSAPLAAAETRAVLRPLYVSSTTSTPTRRSRSRAGRSRRAPSALERLRRQVDAGERRALVPLWEAVKLLGLIDPAPHYEVLHRVLVDPPEPGPASKPPASSGVIQRADRNS